MVAMDKSFLNVIARMSDNVLYQCGRVLITDKVRVVVRKGNEEVGHEPL